MVPAGSPTAATAVVVGGCCYFRSYFDGPDTREPLTQLWHTPHQMASSSHGSPHCSSAHNSSSNHTRAVIHPCTSPGALLWRHVHTHTSHCSRPVWLAPLCGQLCWLANSLCHWKLRLPHSACWAVLPESSSRAWCWGAMYWAGLLRAHFCY